MKLLLLSLLFLAAFPLPYHDRTTLANSLMVGRKEKTWSCKVCDEENKPLASHYIHHLVQDVKCILSVYKDFAVLGFRYTNSLKNVWQDVLYPFQVVDENTCEKCKVQKIYNKMWNTLRYNVTIDLMKIANQSRIETLYITGISLGGGLAMLSFVDIFNDKLFKRLHVITFGSPKVGNKVWAQWFDSKTNSSTLRYMIKGDPIVNLPECFTALCNYKHVGKKIVCYSDTRTCELERETDVIDPKWQIESVDEDISHMGSIMDHIEGYPKIYNYTYEQNPKKRVPKPRINQATEPIPVASSPQKTQ